MKIKDLNIFNPDKFMEKMKGRDMVKSSAMIRCHLIWNESHTEVIVIPDPNGEFLVPKAYKQDWLVRLIEGKERAI